MQTLNPTQPATPIPIGLQTLREGEMLEWPEFERRYMAMPDQHRIQLLRGQVYVDAKEVHWYALEYDRYVEIERESEGILESREFPGLRLDVDAYLQDRLADTIAAIR
jgi:hypothetical protein